MPKRHTAGVRTGVGVGLGVGVGVAMLGAAVRKTGGTSGGGVGACGSTRPAPNSHENAQLLTGPTFAHTPPLLRHGIETLEGGYTDASCTQAETQAAVSPTYCVMHVK